MSLLSIKIIFTMLFDKQSNAKKTCKIIKEKIDLFFNTLDNI